MSTYSCDYISAWSTFVAAFVALIVAFIGLPVTQRWLNRPKIKLKLIGPTKDQNQDYWHLEVQNFRSVAKECAIYVTGFKENGGNRVFLPQVRLEWPYEAANKDGRSFRSVYKKDHVDFFSSESGGKLHLTIVPTKLTLPTVEGFLDIYIKALSLDYEGDEEVIRISKQDSDGGWQLNQHTCHSVGSFFKQIQFKLDCIFRKRP